MNVSKEWPGEMTAVVELKDMTFRQVNSLRRKYFQPKLKQEGEAMKIDSIDSDLYGLMEDGLMLSIKKVSIQYFDGKEDLEVEIKKIDDTDKIPLKVMEWLSEEVMKKFFQANVDKRGKE